MWSFLPPRVTSPHTTSDLRPYCQWLLQDHKVRRYSPISYNTPLITSQSTTKSFHASPPNSSSPRCYRCLYSYDYIHTTLIWHLSKLNIAHSTQYLGIRVSCMRNTHDYSFYPTARQRFELNGGTRKTKPLISWPRHNLTQPPIILSILSVS